MSLETHHEMKIPLSSEEWRAYHAIRRKMLFENRGLFGVYDEHHPDQFLSDNHPFILLSGGEVVGTIRVDIEGDHAVFRQVAVREDVQRAGHGSAMMARAEAFARARGCKSIQVNANPGAVDFYERCGFEVGSASLETDVSVLMQKHISGPRGEP